MKIPNPYQAPALIDDDHVVTMPGELRPRALQNCRMGLESIGIGLLTILIDTAFIFIALVLDAVSSRAVFTPITLIIFSLAFLAAVIFIFVGNYLCLSAPLESRAASFIRTSTLSQFTYAVIVLLTIFVGVVSQSNPGLGNELGDTLFVLHVGGLIFLAAGYLCSCIFLRRLTKYIHREDLANGCRYLIALTIIALAGIGLASLSYAVRDQVTANGIAVFGIFSFVAFLLISLTMNLVIVIQTAKAIRMIPPVEPPVAEVPATDVPVI